MIRIDEIWLSTQPMDMRASTNTAMVRVLIAFGYINRITPTCSVITWSSYERVVHDGLGIWLCDWRLEQGKFH